MKKTTRILLVLSVALAAAGAGILAARSLGNHRGSETPAVAEATAALLALELPDSDDRPQALAQWRGKIIVANFWATWCPPCRKEIPDFAAVSRDLAAQPVQFVGISIDHADSVKAFALEHDVPYPLLIAGPQVLDLASGFGNAAQGLPFTVIIDRDGQARHIKLGTLNRSELEGKIRALLPQ